jgi:3-polyprenyl-4-hydroxybenzoate decarboxylase
VARGRRPFITLPLVYTTHPDRTGTTSACTGCSARRAQHGHALADRQGRRLSTTRWPSSAAEPAGDGVSRRPPALILSAVAPLPENVPELMLASLIAGERLPQVHGSGRIR